MIKINNNNNLNTDRVLCREQKETDDYHSTLVKLNSWTK
jgi:hypothetical protein